MPQLVDPSAAGDQQASDVPAAVADSVVERGAAIDSVGASTSAPPSMSAATSTSSLLAAQCSGVSEPGPRARGKLGSAPAAMSKVRNAAAVGEVAGPVGDDVERRALAASGVDDGPHSHQGAAPGGPRVRRGRPCGWRRSARPRPGSSMLSGIGGGIVLPTRVRVVAGATMLAVFYVVLWASAYVPSKIGGDRGAAAVVPGRAVLVAGVVMAGIALALCNRPFHDAPQWLVYAAWACLANAAYLGADVPGARARPRLGHGLDRRQHQSAHPGAGAPAAARRAVNLAQSGSDWRSDSAVWWGSCWPARARPPRGPGSWPGIPRRGLQRRVDHSVQARRGSTDLLAINTIRLLAAGLALDSRRAVARAGTAERCTGRGALGVPRSCIWCAVLSVGASLLWFWLLSHGAASRVSAFYFLTPDLRAGLRGRLLGEAIGPGDAIGLVAVALGIVLVQRAIEAPRTGSLCGMVQAAPVAISVPASAIVHECSRSASATSSTCPTPTSGRCWRSSRDSRRCACSPPVPRTRPSPSTPACRSAGSGRSCRSSRWDCWPR